jgi:hypothetical protein
MELNEEHRDVFSLGALCTGHQLRRSLGRRDQDRRAGAQRLDFHGHWPHTNLAARFRRLRPGRRDRRGASTAERILGFFVLENLGEKSFKNVSQPLRVYRIIPPGCTTRSRDLGARLSATDRLASRP